MTLTLKNPKDENHFAQVRTSKKHIQVYHQGECIAETYKPLVLTENGRSLYDSVYYIPMEDLKERLQELPMKESYCPIKGNASYYLSGEGEEIAWSYSDPKHEASILKGYMGFDLNKVDLYLLSD